MLFFFILLFIRLGFSITFAQIQDHPNYNDWYGKCGGYYPALPNPWDKYGGTSYILCYDYVIPWVGMNCPTGCSDSDGLESACYGIFGAPYLGEKYGWSGAHGTEACRYYDCDTASQSKYFNPDCSGQYCESGSCQTSTCNGVNSTNWENHPGCGNGGHCIEGQCWYFCNGEWDNDWQQHTGCLGASVLDFGSCINEECRWICGGVTSPSGFYHSGCVDEGHCVVYNLCIYGCHSLEGTYNTDQDLFCPNGKICVSSPEIRTELVHYADQYYRFACRYSCNDQYSIESDYHSGCSYHGSCFNEECTCYDQVIPESGGAIVDWSGSPTCSLPDCNNVCVNGTCATADDVIYCDCIYGYMGAALCDKCNYTSHYRNNYTDCVEYPLCNENQTLVLRAHGNLNNDYECDKILIDACILNDKPIVDFIKSVAFISTALFSITSGNPIALCDNDGFCYNTDPGNGDCGSFLSSYNEPDNVTGLSPAQQSYFALHEPSPINKPEEFFINLVSLYEGYYFNYTYECNTSTIGECCYFNVTYLDCYSLTCNEQVFTADYFNASCEETETIESSGLNCSLECGTHQHCALIEYTLGVYTEECVCEDGYYRYDNYTCKEIYYCNGIQQFDYPNVCGGNGNCIFHDTCQCRTGYELIGTYDCQKLQCNETYWDDANVCSDHGKCVKNVTGSKDGICDCTVGWTGSNCEIPICQDKLSTDSTVCNYENGTCTSPDNCVCNEGWRGDECEITDCDNLCNNHQDCAFNGAEVVCSCLTGWNGTTCQTPVCEEGCNSTYHKACYYPEQCVCENNYYLFNDTCIAVCTECDQSVGICTAPHTCECPAVGYNDTNGDGSLCTPFCSPECNETENCVTPNVCACKEGYTLNNDTDICETNCTGGCNTGEQCVVELIDGVLVASCECSDGYFLVNGTTCRPGCYSTDCKLGEYCCYPEVYCCKEGYYRDAGTLLCMPDCSTLYNDTGCPVHYQCTAPDTCVCTDSWEGTNCEIPVCDPACNEDREYCNTNLECVCNIYWIGTNCTTPVCDPGCNITNHKTCIIPGYCDCIDGYFMNLIDECLIIYTCDGIESFRSEVCNYHGDCVGDNTCQCDVGYKNSSGLCVIKTCNDKAWNDLDVCSSNGLCDLDTELCVCNEGYGGINCNVSFCYGYLATDLLNVCYAHGDCDNPNNCSCDSDWQGDQCQTPLCDPACNVHQTCTYLNETVQCICEPHWGGPYCNVSLCVPECVATKEECTYPNNCICNQELGYFYNPFSSQCETVNYCYGYIEVDYSNVCNGNGDCIANNTCKCDNFYSGDECDIYEVPTCYNISGLNFTEVCNGHGNCVAEDDCRCSTFYNGDECAIFLVPICDGISALSSSTCDYHGDCVFNGYGIAACDCDTGYKIVDGHCVLMKCNGIPWNNTFVCSDNGDCKVPDEECNCAEGWTGNDCEKPLCDGKTNDDSLVCNSRGTCESPNLCNCTESDWYGTLCDQTEDGITDPPTHYCMGSDGSTPYFYDQPQACGPNGWCISEDKCLCKCLNYGDVCEYKYFSHARTKYCHDMRLNDRFRTWRRFYED